jgi:hypothetical protein
MGPFIIPAAVLDHRDLFTSSQRTYWQHTKLVSPPAFHLAIRTYYVLVKCVINIVKHFFIYRLMDPVSLVLTLYRKRDSALRPTTRMHQQCSTWRIMNVRLRGAGCNVTDDFNTYLMF